MDKYSIENAPLRSPYERYDGFKGCGILAHAQLGFWGPGKQLWKTLFPELVHYIAFMERLLLQSQALLCPAAAGGS